MASEVKANKLSPSSGTALQIGDASDTITIPTGATFTITDGLGVAGGGTGLTGFTAGDVLYATGTTTLAKLAKGTAEQVLAMNSGATAPDWGSVDLTVLPTITVAKGGTNLSSFTAGDLLYATGSTTLAKLAKGSGSDTLKMNSGATAPEWVTVAAGGGGFTSTQQFVASGTWTRPSDITTIRVFCTGGGGGGGGGGGNASDHAGGGGAGGSSIEVIDVTSISSETVTCGAAGTAGAGHGEGGAGATSSFGSLLTATGGGGGKTGNDADTQGGDGGLGAGGDVNLTGTAGQGGSKDVNSDMTAGTGGGSYWGGGGRGSSDSGHTGVDGLNGSGGGGGSNTSSGGAGGVGFLYIEEYT